MKNSIIFFTKLDRTMLTTHILQQQTHIVCQGTAHRRRSLVDIVSMHLFVILREQLKYTKNCIAWSRAASVPRRHYSAGQCGRHNGHERA